MQSRPKILIVDNSIAFTGAFKSILIFAGALNDQFEFVFAIPKEARTHVMLEPGSMKYFRFPFIEIQRSWKVLIYFPYLLLNTFRLINLCKKENISIVHINDLFNMCGVMIKILKPSIKVVYHIRLMPDSYVKRFFHLWARLISRYADSIVCVSKAVFNSLPSGLKRTVIYDTIVKDKPFQQKTVNTNAGIQLLYLANYIPGKGHDAALKAFSGVVKSIPSIRLVLAGGDMGLKGNKQYKQQLIEYARQEGIENQTTFKEFVEQPEDLIRASDILLNFSESESFSLTCLESLHWGTPLIATNSGGPAELIVPDQTGILVPVGNIEAMTLAILKLALDEDLRLRFSKAGVNHVQENFSMARGVHALSTVYSNLLS